MSLLPKSLILTVFLFLLSPVLATSPRQHSLLYFDSPGRAQVIRICLTLAGVDWHDERLAYSDWATIKPTTPLGSVPVLTIDGVPHVQSVALARYAGRLAGWYPADPWQALVVDEVMESLNELMSKTPRSADPDEFKQLRQDYQRTTMTKYANFVEAAIQRNGGVGVVALQPSIADLALRLLVQGVAQGNWDHVDPHFFETFPGIMATCQMIEEHKDIQAYYNKATPKEEL